MKLWDWAVAAHGAPGADAALTALQDDHGQCVSFLLWAAWSASAGRPLRAADLSEGASLARRWESEVTAPLRSARRALKPAWPGFADAAREALRSRVKADELDAERCLLEALEARTPSRAALPAVVNMIDRLRVAAEVWAAPVPSAALDRLAQIFEVLEF